MSSRIEDLLRLRMDRLVSTTEVYDLAKKGSASNNNGQLPTFISGLIGSSCLIEEIEQDLRPGLTAKWGQVIDNNNNTMSKEIDVIIFKDKPYFEWKKLGYALVPKDNVRAAIEVNTWYGSGVSTHGDYRSLAQHLNNFCKDFFLFCFSEDCCAPTIQKHTSDLKQFGFKDYFVLYEGPPNNYKPLYDQWYRFVDMIRNL